MQRILVIDDSLPVAQALQHEFVRHAEQILSKALLRDRVWGTNFGGSLNVIEVYVKQVRQKLEAAGESRLIHTIRGAGYILRTAPSSSATPQG